MIKIVVEPHADDAFLSMGQHLENWQKSGHTTAIITVFSGTRKRARDAESYANAVRAQWIGCGLVEQEEVSEERIYALVMDAYDLIRKGYSIDLRQYTEDHGPLLPPTDMYIPLALTHPEHVLVRKALEREATGFYVDQPYAITQKNSELVTDLLIGKTVLSYQHPGKRKYRHIPLFKDQSKFFYFNGEDKLLQTFELIVH